MYLSACFHNGFKFHFGADVTFGDDEIRDLRGKSLSNRDNEGLTRTKTEWPNLANKNTGCPITQ